MTKNKTKRVAVIDVGTLKSKFEIREFTSDLSSQILYKDKQLTVLGRDLDKTNNMIVEESIQATIKALNEFKDKLNEYKVDKYIAVTTEAIRKAQNAKMVLERIKTETNISLKVLTQDEEAEIYFHSVSKDFPDKIIAVTDVGGGSVQVVIGKDENIYEKYLFKTGTYYLQERFSTSNHPTDEENTAAYEYVKKQLLSLKNSAYKPEAVIYGTTNIIDFLKAMKVNLTKNNIKTNHPFSINIEELFPLYDKITALNYQDRMLLYPEEPHYTWSADKALINIFTISEYLNVKKIAPSNNNISTGLLLKLLDLK